MSVSCRSCGGRLSTAGECPACALRRALSPEQDLLALIPEAWEVPETVRFVGDYLLLRELGSGAMGEVYQARDVRTHRYAAIKILRAGVPAERFQREIHALAALEHPGIVKVHRDGVVDGRPWFAMDYIEGPSLEARVRGEPLGSRQAVQFLVGVAEALQYAHARGVLHRDLKPSNLLVDPFERVWLADFGLARFLEVDSELTRTGQPIGTPAYMAPEQVESRCGVESGATDVYGLGATLYHLLTGVPPFRGESLAQVMRLVVEQEPASPRILNANVDRDLETICLKCLRKAPADRYATPGEVAQDLKRWQAGHPILARPVGAWQRSLKWARRNPRLAGSMTMTLVSVVVGVMGVAWQWRLAESRRREAVAANHQKSIERAEDLLGAGRGTEAVRLLGQALEEDPTDAAVGQRLYAALAQHPLPRRIGGAPPLGRWVAADFAGTTDALVVRDAERHVWLRPAGSPSRWLPLAEERRVEGLPLFLSDEARCVLITTAGEFCVVDTREGQIRHRVELGEERRILAASADGERCLVASDRAIALLDWGPWFRRRWASPVVGARHAAFDERDGSVWVGGTAGVVRLGADGSIDETSKLPVRVPLLELRYSRARDAWWIWDADGSRLVTAQIGEGGRSPRRFPSLTDRPLEIGFSATGERLVVAPRGRAFHLLDPEMAESPVSVAAHGREISTARVHVSGLWLTTGSDDGTVRVWDCHDGAPRSELVEVGAPIRDAVLSGDGLELCVITMEGEAQLWELPRRRSALHPHPLPVPAEGLRISPNAQFAVLGVRAENEPGEVRTLEWYDVESGAGTSQSMDPALVEEVRFARRSVMAAVRKKDGSLRVFKAPQFVDGFDIPGWLGPTWLSADGARVAGFRSEGFQVWSVVRRVRESWLTQGLLPTWVDFSADADRLAFWDDQGPGLLGAQGAPVRWGYGTGGREPGVRTLSPRAGWLAWVEERGVVLLRTSSGGRQMIPETLGCTALTFSGEDQRCAVAQASGTVRLWRLDPPGWMGVPMRHSRAVNSVDFDPAGRLLVTAAADGTMRLWDGFTGLAMSSAVVSPEVREVRFGADGTWVSSATGVAWEVPRLPPGGAVDLLRWFAWETRSDEERGAGPSMSVAGLRWLGASRTAKDEEPVFATRATTWREYRERRLTAAEQEAGGTQALREASESWPCSEPVRRALEGRRWREAGATP